MNMIFVIFSSEQTSMISKSKPKNVNHPLASNEEVRSSSKKELRTTSQRIMKDIFEVRTVTILFFVFAFLIDSSYLFFETRMDNK